jgi:hypothetical protein
MTKASDKICEIHGVPLKKFKGKDVCEQCLYASNLTYETQKEAIKRFNRSPEGREAAKKYEDSDKGKAARKRYLNSDKYKLRRKDYNERLKQSLAIARAAQTTGNRASRLTTEETAVSTTLSALDGLVTEIRSYLDTHQRAPTIKNVVDTAKRDYSKIIDAAKAQELIDAASNHEGSNPK